MKPLESLQDSLLNKPFLAYWYTEDHPEIKGKRILRRNWYTRLELLHYANHAKNFLVDALGASLDNGSLGGVRIVHYMTANRIEDVILRLCATFTGYVVVPINWQADSAERMLYKIAKTKAKAVIIDSCIEESTCEFFLSNLKKVPALQDVKIITTFDMGLFFLKRPGKLPPESVRLMPIPTPTCPVSLPPTPKRTDEADVADGTGKRELPSLLSSNDETSQLLMNIKKSLKNYQVVEGSLRGDYCRDVEHMIIFTSGTTGTPKGARLSYSNFDACRKSLESFLQIMDCEKIAVLIVNPLHHVNSSAMCFWCLNDMRTALHLVEKYTTFYWKLLATIGREIDTNESRLTLFGSSYKAKLIAPIVSRHLDFLERLIVNETISEYVSHSELCEVISKENVILPIGSAPVGRATVNLFRNLFNGKMPTVRFGSTETCLQICGIPLMLSKNEVWRAFQRGWNHRRDGSPHPGYFIGRDHPPYSRMLVVRSVVPSDREFMSCCEEGESGYLVCNGKTMMLGYVADTVASPVTTDNWYLGLGDVGYFLYDVEYGVLKGVNYYWQERNDGIIIKGGANYSCEQTNYDIIEFITKQYMLPSSQVEVISCGMKIDSEHEDSCCVLIQLNGAEASQKEQQIQENIKNDLNADTLIYHGCKPDIISIGTLPKNFKGEVPLVELRGYFKSLLEEASNQEGSATTEDTNKPLIL